MKKLSMQKIWLFALGQFGWSMLSGLISNWLVYFYEPNTEAIEQGQLVLIPQGRVVLGIITVIGVITATGRIFDAVTDPLIANWSDGCKSNDGRRIPFLKFASLPLAVFTVLVFWSPVGEVSKVNVIFLFIAVMAYYLSITAYCTPYNALIPELGHTQQEKLNISTAISFTFIAGTAVAYMAPMIWGAFVPTFGRVNAIRVTFTLIAVVAFVCMQVPVFAIKEKDYVNTVPAQENAFSSLVSTFKNREFRKFVGSDIFYWIGLTMFQTGLSFFVTSLLGLDETMTTIFFVGMTALSLVFYLPINKLTPKFGKKKMILFAFAAFGCAFFYTGFMGKLSGVPTLIQGIILAAAAVLPMAMLVFYYLSGKQSPKNKKKKTMLVLVVVLIFVLFYLCVTGKISRIPKIPEVSPAVLQGIILTVVAALPMAIFGILPQAVVADIAQSDSKTTGENREGMFYAARTFAFKFGQSFSMLLFTAVSTIGKETGRGYRITAFLAAAFCILGGLIFITYNENKINKAL